MLEDILANDVCNMPTPFELLRVADLVKLAADTATACSQVKADGRMTRIIDISLRIKAAAEDLEQVGLEMERDAREQED